MTRERVVIEAARPAGFFYALQTLNQLLPSRAVMAGVKATDVQAWTLPVVTIKDHPRFEWRGFMLDEGRHFYGKEEIKKLLDVMAAYKLNRLSLATLRHQQLNLALVDADHRFAEVLGDLRDDLRVVEVRDRLDDRGRALRGVAALEDAPRKALYHRL